MRGGRGNPLLLNMVRNSQERGDRSKRTLILTGLCSRVVEIEALSAAV